MLLYEQLLGVLYSTDLKVKGIYRGYEGLINGEIKELTSQDVE